MQYHIHTIQYNTTYNTMLIAENSTCIHTGHTKIHNTIDIVYHTIPCYVYMQYKHLSSSQSWRKGIFYSREIYIYRQVHWTKEKLRWIAARTLSWPQPLPSVGSKLPGSHLWKIWIRMCIHICFCICISISITVSIFICQYLQQSESWILWKLAESQHLQFHFFP